jgi:hypothetical protein
MPLIACLLLCALLAGCGGSEYRFGNQRTLPNLSGHWTFKLVSGTSYAQYQGTADLTQTNLDLQGTANAIFPSCASTALVDIPLTPTPGFNSNSVVSYTLTGTMQEDVSSGKQLVSLSGSASADGNGMSGSYTLQPGACSNGETGTWAASK